MPMQTIAIFFLAAAAMGGVVWVFLYPILSGERKAEQRMASVAKAEPVARAARGQPEIPPRRPRKHAQGDRRSPQEAETRLADDQDRAGRPDLVEAPVLPDLRGHRACPVPGRTDRRRRPDRRVGHGLCRRFRPAALAAVVPQEAPRSEVSQRLPRRRRHHRARRQGRPAAARLPEDDHHRSAGAAEIRIPRHSRYAGHRHAAGRSLRQALRAHAGAGGELLRHHRARSSRRPAAILPRRSATCRACCATARR